MATLAGARASRPAHGGVCSAKDADLEVRAPARLGSRAGEQQEIAVGIAHDEIARAPGLLLECLMERHARVLELQEELADFRGAVDGDRSGKQAFALADIAHEHRLAHHPEVEPGGAALDLAIERRLAVDEHDAETKLAGEEVARG